MTTIANPIYDVAFKYLMEDERIVRLLLSALLRMEVLEVKSRRNELVNVQRDTISIFRLDFSAVVRTEEGREQQILIELQKTELPTELLRFRQYIGSQYLNEENMVDKGNDSYALPMVAIYLLGHRVGTVEEPVVYAYHTTTDYEGQPVTKGMPDPFIESLNHNTIIVQIPLLHGKVRNRLEKLLNVFDQARKDRLYPYLLNIDEADFADDPDMSLIVHRLVSAASKKEVRDSMRYDDIFFKDYDQLGIAVLEQKKQLYEQDMQLKEQNMQLKEQDIQLKEQDNQLKEQDNQLKEQGIQLKEQGIQLKEQGIQLAEKDGQLRSLVKMLVQTGQTIEAIAENLHLDVEAVKALL